MHQPPALPRNTLVLRLRTLQHARPMGAAANSPRSLGDQPGVGPLRSVVEMAHEGLTRLKGWQWKSTIESAKKPFPTNPL